MKFDNQLRHAAGIIHAYKGENPLHIWLKDFFRVNKQMGSRDRKLLGSLVYGFYRLGKAVPGMPVEERLLLGLFLCNETPGELLAYFRPEWAPQTGRPPEEKIAIARTSGIAIAAEDIFPYRQELSAGIDHHAFCLSFLQQPDLFLRIRPGHQQEVLEKLPGRAFIPPFSLRLPNGFKVEEYFTPDKEVVIQDYSSQRIAGFIKPDALQDPEASPSPERLSQPAAAGPAPRNCWDACAASGGKSILAADLYPEMNITVSDLRESILHNLRQRFRQAGIRNYHAFMADLTTPAAAGPAGAYDLILADVPCTGSGTWSRTPEELYFFDPKKIDRYNGMQKKIIANIIPRLAAKGRLVYSTCSVFKKENEEMTALIQDLFGLQPEITGPVKGYEEKADTMFAARFARA